ncbi:hypothetical protein OQX61_23745 [Pedobacter sp. PLR]|uniref:hypothetical protein n=1 Tax=Pedobacter sp. PLR TaxID=2994465 RepID=UPI002246CFE6|nr:hypothetical protein [Pedobacter sp. PLR]MCX2454305.1 hypothetical protein [Pedobacter sp. PLR]
MSKLIIDLNDEYKVKIENGSEFKNSIFKEVYDNAAKIVNEIIKQSSGDFKYDEYNNIIAFTGERGKGKSSSMISFMNSLVEMDENNTKKHETSYSNEVLPLVNKKTFGTIDVIDPSLFRGKESLFEIIIAKMFSKFQMAIKDPNCKISDDDRRRILTYFQIVFDNLKIIKGDRNDLFKQETIEALSNLATSSNLKKAFQDLVETYLKEFLCKDFLVIAIDDFDLNITGAYDMLEDIRQFLIQRKIILLISCRLEQLRDALRNHYDQELKTDTSDNLNKANRYLDKLIPFSKRCDLPELNDVKNKTFEIIDRNNESIFNNEEEDIQTVILDLLYTNHKLFISKSKYRFNSLMPKTLRELQEFFNIIVEHDKLEQLKRYLLSTIKKENIYPDIFDEIDSRNNYNLNLYVVLKLKYLIKLIGQPQISFTSSLFIDETIIKEISEGTNPDNVSIGDVHAFLRHFEALIPFDDDKNNKFIDFIKIYYSIRSQEKATASNNNLLGGIYSGVYRLFRVDGGKKKRDWVEFNYTLKDINDELKTPQEKFILSLFIHITGKNKSYRRASSSPFFKPDFQFENGIFSPIAFLANSTFGALNLNTLNQTHNDEIEILPLLEAWSDDNKLIQQLNNVMFLHEFFRRINIYIVDYKSKLPTEYFDTISFYLINGGIAALNEMIEDYGFLGKDLLTEYISHPLIQSFAKYNHDNNIFVLDESLFDFDNIESFITADLISVINKLYEKNSADRVDSLNKRKEIFEKLEKLNGRIRRRPDFKIQTLSTIINEIDAIDTTSRFIDELSAFKPLLTSKDPSKVEQAKKDLKDYLQKTLNGQS